MLDDFFDKMNAGHLDHDRFTLDDIDHGKTNPHWDPWQEELPPVFHTSAASLGPPDPQSTAPFQRPMDQPFQFHQELPLTGGHRYRANTSPEVLAAASTLVPNGHGVHGSFFNATPNRHNPLVLQPSQQQPFAYHGQHPYGSTHVPSYPPENTSLEPGDVRPLDPALLQGDVVLRDMFFGPVTPHDVRNATANKPADLRWGSDASFFDHGFVAPPNQETVEEVTNSMLGKMECFQPETSAANTQPSSPLINRPGRRASDSTYRQEINPHETGASGKHSLPEAASESKPRKRRKGRLKLEVKGDEDEGEEEEPAEEILAQTKETRLSSVKTAKSKRRAHVVQDRGKRGKSPSGEQKSGRDNLTDEQKRSNHILSEQKRRNLIKQGFDDLCKLVPDLKGGGFSKSAMLSQAAEWLEDLLQGNERLRLQLAELG